MNLDRLHKIFGRKGRLTREDIQAYADADAATKNVIEQKAAADDFGADALEGWKEVEYDTSAMVRLDKQFAPNTNTLWYSIGGVAIVTVIAVAIYVGFFSAPTNEVTSQLDSSMENQQPITAHSITLDETDVILPQPIEDMTSAPIQHQIAPTEIKSDFIDIETKRKEEPKIPVAELPMLDVDIDVHEGQEIMRAHEMAKEIYVHDLKLVDYRHYRTAPTVHIRQVVLNGLPADKESSESEDLDPIWKDVEIPYTEYINKSMRIFGNGSYKRALSRFETVIKTYPLDVNANFYAGVCLFNLGEYDAAIKKFEMCYNGPYSNFDEESLWMKALCLEKSGKMKEAKKLYKTISTSDGFYKSQAQEKLKK